jgi:hypothetical protein
MIRRCRERDCPPNGSREGLSGDLECGFSSRPSIGRDYGRQVEPTQETSIGQAARDRLDSGAGRLERKMVDPDAGEDPRAATARPAELGTGVMLLHPPILTQGARMPSEAR